LAQPGTGGERHERAAVGYCVSELLGVFSTRKQPMDGTRMCGVPASDPSSCPAGKRQNATWRICAGSGAAASSRPKIA
jgi:hypothetical protein